MRTVAVLALLVAYAYSACDDGKNNVIDVANNDGVPADIAISVTGVQAQTYDTSSKPSCKNNEADVLFPGILKIANGQVVVKTKVDLTDASTEALLTLKKNSILIGTLCDHGKSKNVLIPDEYCHLQNPCSILGDEICNIFMTVGTHDLAELEQKTNFTGIVNIPKLNDVIEGILTGPWQAAIDIQTGGKSVAYFKIPSNEQWMQLA